MIVADTSALVSLATADALAVVLGEFDVFTTEVVVEELKETADYDDPSGEAAETVLARREALTVRTVSSPEFETSRIDAGEGTCVTLARKEDADFLVTDDFRALPELKPLVPGTVAISPLVLKALVKREVYTREEATRKLEQIATDRDWLGSPIYRQAKELFSE
ncbi:hypothetical protein [Halorussus salinus]|uniref:hypothetical protein n=1 Tax=Halorussus salinus TaxID=1364935 RepID=UPI0010929DC4|nr:hypothetical protein [Halorussus salinus]